MPHTHGRIIYLSELFFNLSKTKQINTLIHEKIHVYQRMYRDKTYKLYKSLGFKRHNFKSKMIRSNPDNDKYVYSYKGKLFYKKYKKLPKSLYDTYTLNKDIFNDKNYKQTEHPNEIFASTLPELMMKNKMKDKKLIEYFN